MEELKADVRVVTCESWSVLVERQRTLRDELGIVPGEELWFRGANDAGNSLLPSLLYPDLDHLGEEVWEANVETIRTLK